MSVSSKVNFRLKIILTILTVVWLGWALFGEYVAEYFPLKKVQSAGAWGDSFGVLNSLFSAFTFVAALGALLIQGEALKRQQSEIDESKKEQHRQDFERYFFQMLNLARTLQNEVETYFQNGGSLTLVKGLPAIKRVVSDIESNIAGQGDRPYTKEELNGIYDFHVHDTFEDGTGAYFRVIYTMLNRIDIDKSLNANQKVGFSKLLRSQLSGSEIKLIALNGLRPEAKDLPAFLTEYHMLKYMPAGVIKAVLQKHDHYLPLAFAPRDDSSEA